MAAFMFAFTGNFPLAELYHPLHHLMGAGHLALAATFWAIRVGVLAGPLGTQVRLRCQTVAPVIPFASGEFLHVRALQSVASASRAA